MLGRTGLEGIMNFDAEFNEARWTEPSHGMLELEKTWREDLETRLRILEDILSTAAEDEADPDETAKLEISSEQLEALRGISSSFNGLQDCFNEILRRNKKQSRDSEAELPEDLLMKMANPEESAARRASVAFIANTYGGLDLNKPQLMGKRRPKHHMKSVSETSIFARRLRLTCIGEEVGDPCGVNYLPTEFKRLGLDERKSLARMLSWDNLKSWGFNAFDADKMSSGSDSIQGCPIVLIGWAILASPYAQVR